MEAVCDEFKTDIIDMTPLNTRCSSSHLDSNHFVRTQDLASVAVDSNTATSRHLTPRERQTYALVMAGKANKEIAATLGISSRTVKFHVANIFKKRGVVGRLELLAKVVEKAVLTKS
jgi:DNA-binding CsgD family transcriptional regulator